MVNWWENHFVTSKIVCTVITALSASGLVIVLIMKIECGKRVFSEWSQWLAVQLAEYRAEFERLVAEIDDNHLEPMYTNQVKDMLEGGISTELKTVMITVEREEDYKKFADQLQIHDTRMLTLKDDRRSWIHSVQPRSATFP